MQQTYIDTVRLLLDAAPEVFRGGVFAMKGGTAINLFVHGMPRLSVDIDLVYPDWSAPRADALRAIADELAAIADRLQRIGLSARTVRAEGLGESKLLVERAGRGGDALVKIEANLVFRGTVLPTTRRALSPVVSDMFSAEVSVPMLAVDELYGSKLVAAMDRQHPRDLFDVMRLYDAGIDGVRGVTDGMVECFVLYLAGHNRPMDEVLAPRVDGVAKDLRLAYESSFAGMTREPVALSELESARKRLFDELPRRLTMRQRAFLVGLARVEPDWSLVGCAHANELPAIRWRLQNLEQFRDARPREWARQVAALEQALG